MVVKGRHQVLPGRRVGRGKTCEHEIGSALVESSEHSKKRSPGGSEGTPQLFKHLIRVVVTLYSWTPERKMDQKNCEIFVVYCQ
jgi:hypothetical protein